MVRADQHLDQRVWSDHSIRLAAQGSSTATGLLHLFGNRSDRTVQDAAQDLRSCRVIKSDRQFVHLHQNKTVQKQIGGANQSGFNQFRQKRTVFK